MLKDLRRLDGLHFRWTLKHHTRIKPQEIERFRCEVIQNPDQYEMVLKKARSKKRSDILALASHLKNVKRRAEGGSNYLNGCLLYEKYVQAPSRFESELTETFSGQYYRWVKNKYLRSRSKEVLDCELRRRRSKLKAAFKALRQRRHAQIRVFTDLVNDIKRKPTRSCY